MLSVADPLRGSYGMQCLKFGLSHVYLPCKIMGMSGCCMHLNRYRRLRDLCYCYQCGGYGIYAMRSYTINQPPPMEASKRFLVSYLDSLIGIKIDLSTDPRKGKSTITYKRRSPHMIMEKRLLSGQRQSPDG